MYKRAPEFIDYLRDCGILVVEDDNDVRSLIQTVLEKMSYRITLVDNGARGLEEISASFFDLVICDLQMTAANGVSICAATRNRHSSTAILAISRYLSDENKATLEQLEVEFLAKPFRITQFLDALERTVDRQRTLQDKDND